MSSRETMRRNAKSDADDEPAAAGHSRIIVIPKILTQRPIGERGDGKSKLSTVKLRHPRTGAADVFLFDGRDGNVYELMNFKESHGSWFIGDTVQKDGSIIFATPIDPLFLVLPYLAQSKKFRPFDQMIEDDEFSGCTRLLSCMGLIDKLENVAQIKEYAGLKMYCYDEAKCLTWLTTKVAPLIAVLKSRNLDVSTGARAATFVLSRKTTVAAQDDYVRYAHALISEYLAEDVSQAFLGHLGLAKISEMPVEPPAKRCKVGDGVVTVEPLEDYSKGNEKLKFTNKMPPKLSLTQRALRKVDKSGMKSISSFFGKKQ